MRVAIVAPHQWRIPTPAHTGHIVILDLAVALSALGHDITLCAPEGTGFSKLVPMRCSFGQATPTATYCEWHLLEENRALFDAVDVIHDWSCEKRVAEAYPSKSVATVLSGNFNHPSHGRNVVVWTQEMRERSLRGASDYEGTEFTQWHSVSRPLKDARVVAGGVDTEFWCPAPVNMRENFFLWLGRWHPARNYVGAIELAKQNPSIEVAVVGEHPDDATNEHQRECALEARKLAASVFNCRVGWLPKDGHREAVREWYRRARAFLMLPKFREPFGLQQAEALACGTPVVGLRIGSVPEVVDHGVTGLVVEPWYLAQACEKIGAIDPARCREEAVRRFDRSVMAARYAELYAEVAAGGSWG